MRGAERLCQLSDTRAGLLTVNGPTGERHRRYRIWKLGAMGTASEVSRLGRLGTFFSIVNYVYK